MKKIDVDVKNLYIMFLKWKMKVRIGHLGKSLEFYTPYAKWSSYDDIWSDYMFLVKYTVDEKNRR